MIPLRAAARAVALSLAATVSLVAACGDDDEAAAPDGAATTTTATTTTATTAGTGPGPGTSATTARATTTTMAPAPAKASVDWANPAASSLAGAWTLADAAGDGPFIEAAQNGKVAGQIELLAFKVSNVEAVRNALEAGDDDQEALSAWIDEFYADLRSDRAKGCGAGYVLDVDDPVFSTAPDGVVARYGFTGAATAGAPAERTVVFAGLRAGNLVLVSLAGSDDGTCVPVETGFDSATVTDLGTALAPAITRSGLPRNLTAG